ncbi:unnamed protein product, partial [marine sediment metagenome]
PYKPRPGCRYLGCPNRSEKESSYCVLHKKQKERERPTSTTRGYNYRWQKVRRMYLRENPLCVECLTLGIITPATVVDHIEPHRGDYEKFWDEDNMQSLCESCHNRKTAKGL